MKTSEYMDKEISGLTRSRSDDFSSYGNIGGDYDYEESLSPRFGFYSSHPQSSADTVGSLSFLYLSPFHGVILCFAVHGDQ